MGKRPKEIPSLGEMSKYFLAEQNRKMAVSAHAYVRGSTKRFYEWLDASDRAECPSSNDLGLTRL